MRFFDCVAALLAAGLLCGAQRGEEIKLWPTAAPGSEGVTAPEVSKPSVNAKYAGLPGNYTVTHYPTLYVFLPPEGKANGTAMVVAPGGGHRQLVMEKEGWEVADWLNGQGIAAFVLKYRLAKAPDSKYTLSEHVYADADDPVERVSSRPDFNVLVYPWYRPGANKPDAPPKFPIPADAPPVFMVCTTDDRSHVEPTVKFYLELEAKKIPTEMHIYNSGPHGFGLRPTGKSLPVDTWLDRLKDWLVERKLM